jgi:ribosomal protein S18 acetylase RimI-like enzyme
MTITLRPETEEDIPFLQAVYASTRAEELALVDWPAEQKAAFALSQFTYQRKHYREHYFDASFELILRDGVPAGRLYVHRGPGTIHIVDISLLPEFRGNGIGKDLLEALQSEARAKNLRLSIYVEKFNRALALYQRLGFQVVGEQGPVYLYMEYSA